MQPKMTSAMPVISNFTDLRGSRFGRPDPRHGLELLYWFSCEYIDVDYNRHMKLNLHHPNTGDFGFHLFHNNEGILPRQNLPYYEMGNLHVLRSNDLPLYVKRKFTGEYDGSNKDRIIISLIGNTIERVYVTEHVDQRNFNPNHTYEVSQRFIEQIRKMELKQFLQNFYNNQPERIEQTVTIDIDEYERFNHSYVNEKRNTSRCWCTIL